MPGDRSEQGETLIEILLAVAIMGLIATALVGALMSMIAGSEVHRRQAVAETDMRRYAEAVKTATYKPAGGYVAGDLTSFTPSSGMSYTLPAIQGVEVCFDAPANTSCYQRLALRVFSVNTSGVADGRIDQTLQIIKRKP